MKLLMMSPVLAFSWVAAFILVTLSGPSRPVGANSLATPEVPAWLNFTPPLQPELPPPPPLDNITRWVRCRSPRFPLCFLQWQLCPLECPSTCLLDCQACRPVCSCNFPGAVCQDPRFVGGDGNTFYFHGQKDRDFCLVSDPGFHINGHLIGKRNPKLKRDFTWVQSIGVVFGPHTLMVGARRAGTWDDKIDHLQLALDGTRVNLPDKEGYTWLSPTTPRVSFTRTGPTNKVAVEVDGKFKVEAVVVPITEHESRVHGYNITSEDCFTHLELGFKFYNLSDVVDGVLGQTYRKDYVSKAKVGAVMPVMGGAHRFSSSGLFATDCAASRFGKVATEINKLDGELAKLHCTSGQMGSGIVCKK